jgi:hypothetical protein
MTTEQLFLDRSDDGIVITTTATTNEWLPTVVINLGPDLTVEINPAKNIPIRIASDNYPQDRQRLEAILGPEATALIDIAGPGTRLPFKPGPWWTTVHELAEQRWNLDWNPLPLDPTLLALDLLCAEQQALTLTGDLPDLDLAKRAYPAAQTLSRLLESDAIAPESRARVSEAIEASETNTPLNHTDITPYTLPLPLTSEEVSAILEPSLPPAASIATGSPDWRLSGHGPASTAENAIFVLPHGTNQNAITITIQAKPHTHPENTPTYQALITDPGTGHTSAIATLRYNPASNTYTGHTTPRAPIRKTDLVDIRHPSIGAKPQLVPEERQSALRVREAIRAYITEHPVPAHGITRLVHEGTLLAEANELNETSIGFVEFLTQSDYVPAAKTVHIEQTGSRESFSIGLEWTIDRRGTSIHLAIDALKDEHPPLSGVRLAVKTKDSQAIYLVAFSDYDTEYVVAELKVPLPSSEFSIAVDPARIDFPRLLTPPEGQLAESIAGSGPETLEAWKEIAEKAPKGSVFASTLAEILYGAP